MLSRKVRTAATLSEVDECKNELMLLYSEFRSEHKWLLEAVHDLLNQKKAKVLNAQKKA